ncbi:hypothetical protein Asppvi_005785 [Aspergillus pseudoviridinutans]|uniref:Uncharacterized protein n=1 Tax=Aspergillus pseudoviridinutans TaxID=1517512 RepID=A0A9P3EUQ9_9EURO|nr:uncharacterized protein Asppvi_005785 [Aspergillus pseudoviridinutans]GIJ86887.1 hypothetical protein Asppvi_005785 [Aspergillus pseudoviridinutans]
MRYFNLHSALLLIFMLDRVSGLGARGATEKVLYFYAYLCETAMATDQEKTTIAPDCAFAMKTERGMPCDLNQFLHYIWAPNPEKPDEELPKGEVKILKNGVEVKPWDATIEQVYNVIANSPFRDYADPVKVNGESDYYTSLSKLGKPIAAVEEKLKTYALQPKRKDFTTDTDYKKAVAKWAAQLAHKAKVEQLVALAKEAARVNLIMRYKDMEEYRIKNGMLASQKYLGVTPMTKEVKTGLSSPPSFQALSSELTLAEYEKKQKISGFRKTFLDACRKYRTDDADHFRALAAAESALRGTKCEVPQIDGL